MCGNVCLSLLCFALRVDEHEHSTISHTPIHTHIHTQTHTYTYTHTLIHTYINKYMPCSINWRSIPCRVEKENTPPDNSLDQQLLQIPGSKSRIEMQPQSALVQSGPDGYGYPQTATTHPPSLLQPQPSRIDLPFQHWEICMCMYLGAFPSSRRPVILSAHSELHALQRQRVVGFRYSWSQSRSQSSPQSPSSS